jgi:hypothetical protein
MRVSKGPRESLDQGARHNVIYIVIQPSSLGMVSRSTARRRAVRKLVGIWRCPCLPRSLDLDHRLIGSRLRSGLPSEVDCLSPSPIGTWYRSMWGCGTDRKRPNAARLLSRFGSKASRSWIDPNSWRYTSHAGSRSRSRWQCLGFVSANVSLRKPGTYCDYMLKCIKLVGMAEMPCSQKCCGGHLGWP